MPHPFHPFSIFLSTFDTDGGVYSPGRGVIIFTVPASLLFICSNAACKLRRGFMLDSSICCGFRAIFIVMVVY